ncbi:MAG: metallophosphoesterase family protein [Planctomycetes bacterium]|nr:metallophosphoesterase family protein [Planctomycetota bacterium]
MRYAIISDIHSNTEALRAVVDDFRAQQVDRVVCLGDVVGYGAEPRECIEMVRELSSMTIAGNHDWAAIEKTSIEYFNRYAKEATYWTREALTDEDKEWIQGLPLVEKPQEDIVLAHSTLYVPEAFDYIQTSYDAYLSFEALEGRVCFVGHSHIPITFFQEDQITYSLDPIVRLPEQGKAIVNVGSVGQPRDNNPRASYGIYDAESRVVEVRRVDYDIEGACRKIIDAGLPEVLGERLKVGR